MSRAPKETGYYDALGVEVTASKEEINKAWKKMALKYHPDKNPGNKEAAAKFNECKEAHEVLTDDDKRQTYDRYGKERLQQQESGGGGNPFGGDIFETLFRDGFGGHGHSRSGRPQAEDVAERLPVTLEDLYVGRSVPVTIDCSKLCGSCKGTGSKSGAPPKDCRACRGQGFRVMMMPIGPGMMTQVQAQCDDCGGLGQITNDADRCKPCKGKKIVSAQKVVQVEVPAGSEDRQQIRLQGQGNEAPGADTGNLIIVLQQLPHQTFQRKEAHLIVEKEITLTEALCGFKFYLAHLDGRKLLIESPPGQIIQGEGMKAILNEGMPFYKNSYYKGSLFIHFKIVFPEWGTFNPEALETVLPFRSPLETEDAGDDVEAVGLVSKDEALQAYQEASHGARRTGRSATDEDEPSQGTSVRCPQQ
jgi:DnaJ family protein A protein 2